MKKFFVPLLVLCILWGMKISFSHGQQSTTREIQDISIIQLISTPEKFHHKKIRVIGFAVIEFEGTDIYFSKEFADYRITKNAIWLEIEPIKQFEEYDEKYVLVEGIFDKNDRGHLDLSSGSIKHINRIEEWKKIE